MAWTAPRTWVTGETVTAALMNTHVRDNLLETAAAKVTTAGDIVYGTAANSLSRLAAGTSANFLRGGTSPSWSNALLGSLTLGSQGATSAVLAVNATDSQIQLYETDSGTDPADSMRLSWSGDAFSVYHRDNSAASNTTATSLSVGDYILHTGVNGTGTGAVVYATDTSTTATAITTGSGITYLTSGSLTTGGPAYVELHWQITVNRSGAGSGESVTITVYDDGVSIGNAFTSRREGLANIVAAVGDEHTVSGVAFVRHTSNNTSTYTIGVSSSTASRFEATQGVLLVRSVQYPT